MLNRGKIVRGLAAGLCALVLSACVLPAAAFAQEAAEAPVDISADGDAARIEGCAFAVQGFQRVQVGSNRPIDEVYQGYAYLLDGGQVVVVDTASYAVVYVPPEVAERFGISEGSASWDDMKRYASALDAGQASGAAKLADQEVWYLTTQQEYQVGQVVFRFDQELREGRFYTCIRGADGSDVKDAVQPLCADTFQVVAAKDAVIAAAAPPLQQLADFLGSIDYSPLWVTLKTTGVAIVFIFVLGLAAAYFTMRIPKRAQDIFDTIFTIPMVLPPTVCGFILLWCLGRNTAVGQWFIDIGFPLIFSWPATVIAATVVAFPLMYRSCRGAFENLDANMMDAARTLGWSNARIFFRLMIPLSWGSIAAATVLAFARALGEFGATLFLAGNYVGVTRTIPIAIYFEWMGGNTEVAWFWTAVILVFSFVVILLINLLGRRTTKYRQRSNQVKPPRGQSVRAQASDTDGGLASGEVQHES